MLYVRRVLRQSIWVLNSTTSLVPNTYEIIGSVVLGNIYWIIPCAYPFPEYFIVKILCSSVFSSPSIRRVAINNVTILILIVNVVYLCEINFGYVNSIQSN